MQPAESSLFFPEVTYPFQILLTDISNKKKGKMLLTSLP